jgi:hypothetical protein
VLNTAGWTYVAATLQSLLTLLYYAVILFGGAGTIEKPRPARRESNQRVVQSLL